MLQAGSATQNEQTFNKIWFTKVLGFVSMHLKPIMKPSEALFMVHNNKKCGFCTMHIDEQYVFVQYCDFIPEEAVLVDGVDDELKCIWLKWYGRGEAENERKQVTVFALCPLHSVRVRVDFIRSNLLVHLLHDTIPYEKALREI